MYQLLLPRSVLVVIPGRITSTIQHFSKKGGGNLILQKPPQYPTRDYSLLVNNNHDQAQGKDCSVIHFQGYLIRFVSCYTLLSGYRLPWSPSNCQNQTTPFLSSTKPLFRPFFLVFGSFHIANSAYQNQPTKSWSYSQRYLHSSKIPSSYPLKVWE